jgi:steroid 5-alpha reductase family enzyme
MIVGSPILVINTYGNQPINIFDSIVFLLIFLSITLEAVSDYQLNRFKSEPTNEGKIYTGGLWKYSQHPNYFFEILVWFGFWIIALLSVPLDQILWAVFSVIGPILITLSLLRVSGIPLLRSRFKDSMEYSEYQKRTSLLIPWFPKK